MNTTSNPYFSWAQALNAKHVRGRRGGPLGVGHGFSPFEVRWDGSYAAAIPLVPAGLCGGVD
jgi:hypothetical protein